MTYTDTEPGRYIPGRKELYVTFHVECDVIIPDVGKSHYATDLEFDDNSNVFGRVLDFRNHMREVFPGCEYKLIKAKQVQSGQTRRDCRTARRSRLHAKG